MTLQPDEAEFAAALPPILRQAPQSVSFKKLRKRLLRQVRQAIDDFAMVPGKAAENRPRWLIGLSGGKDSYGLLAVLVELQWLVLIGERGQLFRSLSPD